MGLTKLQWEDRVKKLDAYLITTYRGYDIYYEPSTQCYFVAASWSKVCYSTLAAAKKGIDDYLGPPPAENKPPVAVIDGPYSGEVGKSIYFYSAGSYDPDGDPLTYSWRFGDGGTSTSSNPIHVYSSAGTYTVSLTVSDGRGGSSSASTPCTITKPYVPPPEPEPSFLTISAPSSVKVEEAFTVRGALTTTGGKAIGGEYVYITYNTISLGKDLTDLATGEYIVSGCKIGRVGTHTVTAKFLGTSTYKTTAIARAVSVSGVAEPGLWEKVVAAWESLEVWQKAVVAGSAVLGALGVTKVVSERD